jgi:hypothetical protein
MVVCWNKASSPVFPGNHVFFISTALFTTFLTQPAVMLRQFEIKVLYVISLKELWRGRWYIQNKDTRNASLFYTPPPLFPDSHLISFLF